MGKPQSKQPTANAEGEKSNANSNNIEIIEMINGHKESTFIALLLILLILVLHAVVKIYNWHKASIKRRRPAVTRKQRHPAINRIKPDPRRAQVSGNLFSLRLDRLKKKEGRRKKLIEDRRRLLLPNPYYLIVDIDH